jgi:hypothetical protein
VQACGVSYLDGAILASPSMVRGGQAKVLVCGPRAVFDPSGNASIHTWTAWAETLVRVADDAGISSSLPRAHLECMGRTVELGNGDKDFPAVNEAFRPASTAPASS